MREDIKELWITALEGDEYVQGRSVLHRAALPGQKEEFCCLGVLCDLAVKEGVITRQLVIDIDSANYLYGEEREGLELPWDVRVWAGLKDEGSNPFVTITPADSTEPYATSLAVLNDKGTSFREIAKVIREQL